MNTSTSRRTFIKSAGAAALFSTAATASSAIAAEESWDYEADLVIVGAGGAGLMAALAASEKGATSFIFEKGHRQGGDTAISEQGYQAPVPHRVMEETGKEDSTEAWLAENINSHCWSRKGLRGEPEVGDLSWVTKFCDLSDSTFAWTEDVAGIEWASNSGFQSNCFGQPVWETTYPRSFNATNLIMPNLIEMGEKDENIQVVINARVFEIVMEDGRAVGAKAIVDGEGVKTAHARKGVLIASGSFNGDDGMVEKYLGYDAAKLTNHNTSWNTGDGIKLAEQCGAALRDMDLGTAYLPCTRGSRTMIAFNSWGRYTDLEEDEMYRAPDAGENAYMGGGQSGKNLPGMLVNYDGVRYASETSGYNVGGYLLSLQKWGQGFYVVDNDAAWLENGSFLVDGVNFEDDNFITADTIEELAYRMNVPVEAFVAEVEKYNSFVDAGEDADFGRAMKGVPRIEKAPFYAVPLESQHYTTYGGIAVDVDTHVLDTEGNTIPGLYAAGIVCGSFTEQAGIYYGSGVAQALIFGRYAGQLIADEM